MKHTKDFFDSEFYLSTYEDVSKAKSDPFIHFVLHGFDENRKYRSAYNLAAFINDYKSNTSYKSPYDFMKNTDCSKYRTSLSSKMGELANLGASPSSSESFKLLSLMKPNLLPYNLNNNFDRSNKPRLTLIVPTLDDKKIYGGIKTALDFFEFCIKYNTEDYNFRVISHDDDVFGDFSEKLKKDYGFDFISAGQECIGNSIESGKDREKILLRVRSKEIFITTFWTTSFALQSAIKKSDLVKPKILHFLQDFEPNFYSFNSQNFLCRDSLSSELTNLFVVNSHSLAKYFVSQYNPISPVIPFTPRLNSGLVPDKVKSSKKNIILVYARHTPRNLLDVVKLVLTRYVEENEEIAKSFEFVGVGDVEGKFPLGKGITFNCLGKLSITEYKTWLTKANVGLSLMHAPHPSYPPLEMASNGLKVVTNDFDCKEMNSVHKNIISSKACSVDDLVSLLKIQCDAALSNEASCYSEFSGFLTGFDRTDKLFTDLVDNKDFTNFFSWES